MDGAKLVAALNDARDRTGSEAARIVAADPEYWGPVGTAPDMAIQLAIQALIALPDAARAIAEYAEATHRGGTP